MRIGLDIMGSDHGPEVPMKGAVMAARELPADVQLVLIGDPEAIAAGLAREGVDPARFEVVASHNDITMQDSATKALQSKPESSISLGFGLMKAGRLDAFASTGNTGAMLVGAVLSVKPIPGIIRPCIPSVVPKENGQYGIMLDVGANADCKPDVLTQFGLLGHLLAQARVRGLQRLSLETGAEEFFIPARQLYERHGFAPCPPFADYWNDPNSRFYTKEL